MIDIVGGERKHQLEVVIQSGRAGYAVFGAQKANLSICQGIREWTAVVPTDIFNSVTRLTWRS